MNEDEPNNDCNIFNIEKYTALSNTVLTKKEKLTLMDKFTAHFFVDVGEGLDPPLATV
jgi:predicted Kef-type K+ transport protein